MSEVDKTPPQPTSNPMILTPREISEFIADCRILIAHSRTFYEVRDALSKAVAIIETSAPETKSQGRDAEHCDYPDCEQHWTHVVAQARALLEPLADCDPAIRQWLKTPDLPRLPESGQKAPGEANDRS